MSAVKANKDDAIDSDDDFNDGEIGEEGS